MCSFLMGKPTFFAVNGYKDLINYLEHDNQPLYLLLKFSSPFN